MCLVSLKVYLLLNGVCIPIILNAFLNGFMAWITYKNMDTVPLFAEIPNTCFVADIIITALLIDTLTWIISGFTVRSYVVIY